MKKVFLFLLWLSFSPLLLAQTLHSIIFANTFDKSIGESCLSDYEQMEIELSTAAAATQMNFLAYHFRGYDFNKDRLIEVLNSLKCQKDDVVFFYYTGHGSRLTTQQSKFPLLILGNKDNEVLVSLAEINQFIASKNPRLRIIIADACNSFLDKSAKGLQSGSTIIKDITSNNYGKLFNQVKGSIIASSSSVGEISSAYQSGGAFTLGFLDAMQQIVTSSQAVSWQKVFQLAKESTEKLAGHTPQFDISVSASQPAPNPTPDPTPPPPPVVVDNYLTDLVAIANENKSDIDRIKMINPTLQKVFANNNAKVIIVGKNGTVVETETAENFVKRLSSSAKLIQLVEVGSKKNANGKVTELKVHEIYKF